MHRGETDRSVVSRVLLLTLFKDGYNISLFQSPWTSPDSHDFSNIMERCLATTSDRSLRRIYYSCVWIAPLGSFDGGDSWGRDCILSISILSIFILIILLFDLRKHLWISSSITVELQVVLARIIQAYMNSEDVYQLINCKLTL